MKVKTKRELLAQLNLCLDQFRKNHINPTTTPMMQHMLHGQIRGLCFSLGIVKPFDDQILAGWRPDGQ